MKPDHHPPQLNYRADIDGLRAVAVLAVVVFHAYPASLMGGFVGVDVFFVISGYLISRIILSGLAQGEFRFLHFYANRVRRIFPALALVLCVSLVVGWNMLLPAEFEQLGKHAAASAGFVQNFVLLREHGYFDVASELKPLMHLWSLAIEEQFYLVYPAVIWGAWRLRLRMWVVIAGLALASFLANVVSIRTDATLTFFAPHTRVWELLAGALLAQWHAGRSRWVQASLNWNVLSVLGAALILASIALLSQSVAFPGWYAVAPVLGACLMIAAGPQAWINRRVLSNRAVVWVGLISYPLYLWHWPILSFARILWPEGLTSSVTACAVALSVVLAWLTYQLVERPLRFGRRRKVAVAGLATAVGCVGALGLGVMLNAGLVSRFPPEVRQLLSIKYDVGLDARVGTCWLYDGLAADAFAKECFDVGNDQRAPSIVLWGDSYAARLYAGMRKEISPETGMGQFSRNSCPPVVGLGTEVCQQGTAHILQTLKKNPPKTVILFGAWNFYGTDWSAKSTLGKGLLEAVRSLDDAGVENVVVIGPAPRWSKDLPKLVFEHWARRRSPDVIPERMSLGLLDEAFEVDAQMTLLFASAQATYFSTMKSMCSEEGCIVGVSGPPRRLVSWDHGHFTVEGARYLGAHLLASKTVRP